MRYGVNLRNYGARATPESVVAVARRAEELGYDSVWTTDHVLVPRELSEPFGHLYETLSTLAYLAGATDTVELGTSVLVLPQREPVLVAKQAATINALSGGRLTLGVGVGWMEREYEYLGADFAGRGRVADEYLDVLRTLWDADGPVDVHGPAIDLTDAIFSPAPGHGPRIVIGGGSAPAFRRVARTGDGWHAIDASPRGIADGVAAIDALGPTRPVEVSLRIAVALDRAPGDGPGSVLHGSVDRIAEQVAAYEEAGVDHLVVDPDEPDVARTVEVLETLAGTLRGDR